MSTQYTTLKMKQIVEYIQDDNQQPFFYVGQWPDVSREMTGQNMDKLLQGKNLPFIFLHDDFDENVNDETKKIKTSIYLYIIDEVEDTSLSVIEQEEQIFPDLQAIEERLKRGIIRKNGDYDPSTYNRKQYPYHTDIANKINRKVYVLRMFISNFTYFKNC